MTRAHIAAFALLAVIGTAAGAQETARVAVPPGSKLRIDGTSNLHAWTCRADKLTATIDFDAANAAVVSSAPTTSMKRVEVQVPVNSLKCGHGAMDGNLYKALGCHRDRASRTVARAHVPRRGLLGNSQEYPV